MHLLPTTLARLADVADRQDSSRFALANVRVELHPHGGWTADATDTKRLLRVSGAGVAPAAFDDYPRFPGITSAPNGASVALVPAAAWRKAFSGAAKHTRKVKGPLLRSVAVVASDRVTTFGATDGTAPTCETVPNGEGRFPPVPDILRQRKGTRRVFTVDAELLAEQLRAIADICGGDEITRVEFSAESPDKPVHLLARTDALEVSGVIMPLSDGGKVAPAAGEEDATDPDELANLRAALADAESRANTFRVERDAARKREDEYARLIDDVRRERDELRERLAAAESDRDAFRATLNDTRAELSELGMRPADVTAVPRGGSVPPAELAELDRLSALLREAIDERDTLRGMKAERNMMREYANELERDLNRARAELANRPVPPVPPAVAPAGARPLTRAERVALIRAAQGATGATV